MTAIIDGKTVTQTEQGADLELARGPPGPQEALQSLSGQLHLEPGPGGPEPGEWAAGAGALPPMLNPPPPMECSAGGAAGGEAGDGPSLSDAEDGGGADSDLEDSAPGRLPSPAAVQVGSGGRPDGRAPAEGMGAPFGLHL